MESAPREVPWLGGDGEESGEGVKRVQVGVVDGWGRMRARVGERRPSAAMSRSCVDVSVFYMYFSTMVTVMTMTFMEVCSRF